MLITTTCEIATKGFELSLLKCDKADR